MSTSDAGGVAGDFCAGDGADSGAGGAEVVDAAELFGGAWPPAPTARARATVLRALAPGGLGLVLVRGGARGAPPRGAARAAGCERCARARLLGLAFELGALDAGARGALLAAARLGRDAPRAATLGLTWDVKWAPAADAPRAGAEVGAGAGAGGAGAPPDCGCAPRAAAGGVGEVRDLVEALGGALAAAAAGVAAAADAALDGAAPPGAPRSALLATLLAARGAKARLIMYEPGGGGGFWQPWHYDYGLFTALASPAYESVAARGGVRRGAAPPPCGAAGLVVRAGGARGDVPVHVPPGCVAVQVGEAAQILSGGRLAAAAHAVIAPPRAAGGAAAADELLLARAALVVFCLPPWAARLPAATPAARDAALAAAAAPPPPGVPPLAARWLGGAGDDAQTFAAFEKATTAAYFGAGGTQRRR